MSRKFLSPVEFEGTFDGVQYFHQTTKPITRPNGDVLVIGDRWWKTDDGTEWFWNGTYWLSVVERIMSRGRIVSGENNVFPSYTLDSDVRDVPARAPLFLDRVSYTIMLASLGDENNYRLFRFGYRNLTGSAPFIYSSTNKLYGTLDRIFVLNEPVKMLFIPELFDANVVNNQFGFTFGIYGAGSSPPNGINPAGTLYFRTVFL